MFPFWWGWGWIAGLASLLFWVGLIVVAVLLLRREVPNIGTHRWRAPPAVRLLEERYARGEITREEFLDRRAVLLGQHPGSPPAAPPPSPPAAPPAPAGSLSPPEAPTQPLEPER